MYRALYRKYRPSSFDDVISQPHVTVTLKNQLTLGQTGHCYLFTGSRGTGKTTCARIFAKALICENPHNGEPCLECSVCRDMDEGRLSDVIEIDAASNRGIDDARELREAANYLPERCRYRIYIIDEVHMLTNDAFNALLKIIEEPPAHVKFIMATTEVHKVLPTILSRCQRFDFRRIRQEDICARLHYVAEKESISIDDDAAVLIARIADGGMRDALSILDRCIVFSDRITEQVVSEAAGIAGRDSLFEMIGAFSAQDTSKALAVADELHANSKNPVTFCTELAQQLRNVMIYQNVPDGDGLVACTEAEKELLKKYASEMKPPFVIAAIDAVGKCAERLKYSASPLIELEMALIKLCSGNVTQENAPAQPSPDTNMLLARISELENAVRSLAANGVRPQRAASSSSSNPAYSTREAVTDTSKMNSNALVPLAKWPEILERFAAVCPSMSGTLHGSQAYESENYLLIVTDNNFFLQLLRNKENAQKLIMTAYELTGKKYALRARCTAPQPGASENKMPELLKKAAEGNIPVDIEK